MYFRLGLVSIPFIGSFLYLKILTEKFLPLVFFGGFVLLSSIAITLVSFVPCFVVALGKYLKCIVITITTGGNMVYI